MKKFLEQAKKEFSEEMNADLEQFGLKEPSTATKVERAAEGLLNSAMNYLQQGVSALYEYTQVKNSQTASKASEPSFFAKSEERVAQRKALIVESNELLVRVDKACESEKVNYDKACRSYDANKDIDRFQSAVSRGIQGLETQKQYLKAMRDKLEAFKTFGTVQIKIRDITSKIVKIDQRLMLLNKDLEIVKQKILDRRQIESQRVQNSSSASAPKVNVSELEQAMQEFDPYQDPFQGMGMNDESMDDERLDLINELVELDGKINEPMSKEEVEALQARIGALKQEIAKTMAPKDDDNLSEILQQSENLTASAQRFYNKPKPSSGWW